MKTNVRMVSSSVTTHSPASTSPVTVVISHFSHAPALSKGQVMVRGLYRHSQDGRAEVVVSMDANAMVRKMAAREVSSDTVTSTTGMDSLFSSL